MPQPALAIANRILDSAQERGISLTNMQLIKLIYISHGWSLALLGKPLVDEQPQAWQHGPVYRTVYHAFRESGSRPVGEKALHPFSGTEWVADLEEDEQAIVDQVVEAYGRHHAFSLSARTHQVGTPWHQVWNDGRGKYRPIPNDLIKSHFDDLNARNS
ncbi:type II toxin-antitoxin system antitoxin SocA domain-containing protein [Citromicrobium bathyomarinum]|uniref:Panacea domain-containing protein n=1 Tax=Citromicrobium bathyomarinum TaxID=72174 RepID=UPI00315A1075